MIGTNEHQLPHPTKSAQVAQKINQQVNYFERLIKKLNEEGYRFEQIPVKLCYQDDTRNRREKLITHQFRNLKPNHVASLITKFSHKL